MRRFLIPSVLAVAVAGCASSGRSGIDAVAPQPSSAVSVQRDSQSVPPAGSGAVIASRGDCLYRDLSLPWVSRSSRCYPNAEVSMSAREERQRLLADYLSAVDAEAESTVIPDAVSVQAAATPGAAAASSSRPLRDADDFATRIVFARKIFVLGPKGRAATMLLAKRVAQANKVTLRGVFEPDEVVVDSDLYREKISVARSLAVRKLWSENGIDVSNVVILHFSPDLFGRYVKVNFL